MIACMLPPNSPDESHHWFAMAIDKEHKRFISLDPLRSTDDDSVLTECQSIMSKFKLAWREAYGAEETIPPIENFELVCGVVPEQLTV